MNLSRGFTNLFGFLLLQAFEVHGASILTLETLVPLSKNAESRGTASQPRILEEKLFRSAVAVVTEDDLENNRERVRLVTVYGCGIP